MARKFSYDCAAIVRTRIALGVLVTLAAVHAPPVLCQPVATTMYGDCAIVLMREGDIFMSGFDGPRVCAWTQKPWTLRGNLFVAAGGSMGRVAGVSNYAQVLAGNGDWFQLTADYNGCGGMPSVALQGNVFSLTGVPANAGEEFSTFGGGGPSMGYEYAVTTRGRVFRWVACTGWEYMGALPIGPTPTDSKSWGQLKSRYAPTPGTAKPGAEGR